MNQLTLDKITFEYRGMNPVADPAKSWLAQPVKSDIEFKREIMMEDLRNETAKACSNHLSRQRDIDRIRGYANLRLSTTQDTMAMIDAYARAIEELKKITEREEQS